MTNFWKNLWGTTTGIFKLGIGGALLKKNTASILDLRNTTDSGFANLRVADALTDDDAVTFRQIKDAVQRIEFSLALVTASSVSQIPAGSKVINAEVKNIAAYSPGTTIEVGFTGTPAAFMPTSENDPTELGSLWSSEQNTTVVSAVNVLATVAGGPVVGSCTIAVDYVIPAA